MSFKSLNKKICFGFIFSGVFFHMIVVFTHEGMGYSALSCLASLCFLPLLMFEMGSFLNIWFFFHGCFLLCEGGRENSFYVVGFWIENVNVYRLKSN